MTKETVNIGRPLGYLCVAGVLALGALLLPGGAAPEQLASGAVPSATSAPPSPTQSPACAGVRESLRPTGPLPAAGAMPPGSTMAAIAGRGRLIAGVDQGKFLAGYRDPQTGQLVGADIDIVHSIAKAILGDPDKVQFVVLDIADRVRAVQRGEVDLVVDHFTVTCDRQRSVEFSSAYMTASQRLLVPVGSGVREVEDLAGAAGVHVARVDDRGRAARPAAAAGRGVAAGDPGLCGRDAAGPGVRGLQRRRHPGGTGRAGPADGGRRPGAGPLVVRRRDAADQPDLVRFVNALLERSRDDGSLAASYKRWLSGTLKPVPQPPPARYRD